VSGVLARRDRALTPEETESLLRDRLGAGILGSTLAYRTFTVHVSPEAWVDTFLRCRDEPLLDFDLFDSLFGVDAREDGFDVVAVLYSTSTGNRLALRTRCTGGRERPVCPSVTAVYRGADWMERETWDMFGIEFDGHPGLEPRILTVENFEGWPLRKDFHLASRVVKPWPGVKEPAELDADGNVIERIPGIGDAPGPYALDEVMAQQALARRRAAGDLPEAAATPAPVAATPAPASTDTPVDEAAAAGAADQAEAQRRAQVEARARKAAERVVESETASAESDASAEPDADVEGQA